MTADRTAVKVSASLQSAYDEQYGESMTGWREVGGKYKAQNLLEVCAGHRFDKVLECGAGEGSILKFLDASGAFAELHALEISDSGLAMIERRKLPKLREARKFDGYAIPYPDGAFDMAYCSHVLEHVEHPRVLLRELKRVSRYQAFEVPLDYAHDVDRHVERLAAYGHINVFTPSLFRFLLKSEGYEILAERLTQIAPEVRRFGMYRNQGLPRTLRSELSIMATPILNACRRLLRGRRHFDEFCQSAYTCLARPG